MNDDTMRADATERLLTAELVAVLEPTAQAKAIAWWPRWAAAAVAVFGLLTVLGVASLREGEGAFAQQPAFDPLDPAFDDEWPVSHHRAFVADATQLGSAPADADAIALYPATQELLAAVARRPGLKSLDAWPSRNGPPVSLGALSVAAELEFLSLGPPFPASELRELRHLPRLRRLALVSPTLDFDEASGQAISEARFLRHLVLGTQPPRAEGIRALSGLLDLEFLAVHLGGPNPAEPIWLDELPRLRGLKGLRLEGVAPTGDFAAILSQLPRLRLLDMAHIDCNDHVLAAVPSCIERLQLSDIGSASSAGLLDLGRCRNLRSLGFRAEWSVHRDAVCTLVRKLPLEQFLAHVEPPSDELWKALQEKSGLRLLLVREQGKSLAPQIAQAARCRTLEKLELVTSRCPPVDSFRPLLDLPRLRRLDLHVRNPTERRRAPVPEEGDLRALFAGRVEIHVD